MSGIGSPRAAKRAVGRSRAVSGRSGGKYGAVKTAGYASKREAARAQELRLIERAGKIRNLREQVRFVLIPKQDGERECAYMADFAYEEWLGPNNIKGLSDPTWRSVVEDCKGMKTQVYRIKRKLLLYVHGIRIRET